MTFKNTYNKFLWLAHQSEEFKKGLKLSAEKLFFDEMESIEHTKCKPLAIFMFVNEKYQILEAKVATMPAKGKLSKFSVEKYGKRIDQRPEVAKACFQSMKNRLSEPPIILLSDAKPSYVPLAKKFYPNVYHQTHNRADKDRHRDRIHENHHKKRYDPMHAINQRCALLRAQIRRLTRRSWCTTKKPENLQRHLDIFIASQFGYQGFA